MNASLCGEHHYANITKIKIDAILEALKKSGSSISGNNPWNVDTHNHGITLQGSWNEAISSLTVIVTAKNFYVPCGKIWETIDPLISHISGLTSEDIA